MYVFQYSAMYGVCYTIPIHHAWLWFPDKPGLASGVVFFFFGLSGLVFNNVAVYLVNPGDESPTNEGIYPDSVNARVPYMLKTLSYIYIAIVLLSIVFFFPGEKEEAPTQNSEVDSEVVSAE